mmetsp:Transcript_9957/g.28566  ORF Transcript_9957/g.28566 Transcript_9957/m.28566 type:complete len:83 (-) Transcript_9957:3-251(-)
MEVELGAFGRLDAVGMFAFISPVELALCACDRPAGFGGPLELVLCAFGTPEPAGQGAFDTPAAAAGPGAFGGSREKALGAFG